ncbi:hypothetical protein SDC9_53936 [bioreactor metagenome]|uniref:DUF3320 domain-containing protein n=2 Tax=root TaxID=1 RepID=A0A644VNP5_9ZZZZ
MDKSQNISENEEDNEYSANNLKEDEEYSDNYLKEDNEYSDNNFDGLNIYEGISNIDNPLRRNSFNYKKNRGRNNQPQNIKERMRSVSESINEIKNEVKYINNSLREIENPTAPKKVFVIDRTIPFEEYNDSSDNINKNYNNENYNDNFEDIFNIKNNDNLENIIEDLNEDYVKIEKERAKEKNKLKERDLTRSTDKNKISNSIIDYEFARDIPVSKSEEFYNLSEKKLLNIVDSVVSIEGPIHISEFTSRIKESCNLKRAGPKFKKHINKSISIAEEDNSILIIDDFLFPINWNKTNVRKRKNPNIDLISNEEIEENIKLVLNYISPIDQKELIKKVSRNFGFKSTSRKTSQKINEIIDYMISKQIINNFDGKIEMKVN